MIISAEIELLVRTLAAVDALFWPMREADWRARVGGALYTAQRDFFNRGGVRVPIGGSAAQRKRGERLVNRLEEAGYLIVSRQRQSRFLALTDHAEDKLRVMLGHPGLASSFAAAWTLEGRGFVPEIAFNGGRGWGDGCSQELLRVELLMLPSLLRGYVESNSTTRGHVCYRWLASPPTGWPEVTGDHSKVHPELVDLYWRAANLARADVIDGYRQTYEIGHLPLACVDPSTVTLSRPKHAS